MEDTVLSRQKKLEDLLAPISDWEERYKKIIELGKKLPELDSSFKTEDNLVKGCQSQVWLVLELNKEGRVQLKADSDALIVKGLVALILQIYNNSLPSEILTTPPQFLKSLGLDTHLSPSRANGLRAMIQRIVMFAVQTRT